MEWMIIVTWLARGILIVLIAMSIYAVSIILERRDFFKRYSLEDHQNGFIDLIEKNKLIELKKSLHRENPFMDQILGAFNNKNIVSLQAFYLMKYKSLEEGKSSTLGTYGTAAPFIGLLGTVFGIIVAFGELSAGKVDSNSIMYALAEALILTAVGLVIAIPSVICFNYYSRKLKMDEIE